MKWIRLNIYSLFVQIFFAIICLLISHWSVGQSPAPDTSVGVIETVADTTPADELPNYFDAKADNGRADTIELRHVPAYVMDSLKNDDAFWYANTKLKKTPEKESTRNTPHWLKALTWTIIVATFLAALIWYLATSNILIFEKRRKAVSSDKEEKDVSEDIFSINYHREIHKAVQAEDYRLAIRLMFLQLLRNLSNRNVIRYRQGKTNVEYLSQLFSTSYYNDFFRLMRNYEYAWYGKFHVSRDAFNSIQNDFKNFDQQLK